MKTGLLEKLGGGESLDKEITGRIVSGRSLCCRESQKTELGIRTPKGSKENSRLGVGAPFKNNKKSMRDI